LTRTASLLLIVACAAAMVAAPFFVYPAMLSKILCFALFACAFNLLVGYTGLLSFGHAMFYGGSAYITAYTIQSMGLPLEIGILSGVAAASLLGLGVGLLSIRRQGIYLTMITLAIAQMLFFFFLEAPFTGGEDGIQGVARGKLFGVVPLGSDRAVYFFVLCVFALGFFAVYRTVHSPFGQILRAIRENEARATSLGYDVQRFKLLAFVISAGLSGLAGGMKVIVFGMVSLTDVHWTTSGDVVLMALIGGIGTIAGPVLGAGVIITMQHYLAGLGEWVLAVQGGIFILLVTFMRRGLVGEVVHLLRKRRIEAGSS